MPVCSRGVGRLSVDADVVEEVLKKAGKAVADLPEHLQAKAFELAVSMLSGTAAAAPPGPRTEATRRPATPLAEGEAPDVPDLLRACKRNPDRYLVFMHDMESRGEDVTTGALVDRFRMYKQDVPKLPARDLADMVAKGLVEQLGKGRDARFTLKRKSRERVAQLAAGVNVE